MTFIGRLRSSCSIMATMSMLVLSGCFGVQAATPLEQAIVSKAASGFGPAQIAKCDELARQRFSRETVVRRGDWQQSSVLARRIGLANAPYRSRWLGVPPNEIAFFGARFDAQSKTLLGDDASDFFICFVDLRGDSARPYAVERGRHMSLKDSS